MAPPNQALCFLSAGESTSGPICVGANAYISFFIRACMPLNMVQPPARTILRNRSRLMSYSHFMIAPNVYYAMPSSIFISSQCVGKNSNSGHFRDSSLTEMWCPVGNLYFLVSVWDESVAVLSSAS